MKPRDGDTGTFVLRHGDVERQVTGTLRSFRPNDGQIAELEEKLEQLRRDNGVRWEVVTEGGAVGFQPEDVIRREG